MKRHVVSLYLATLALLAACGDNNSTTPSTAQDMSTTQDMTTAPDMTADMGADMDDTDMSTDMGEDLVEIPPKPWDITKPGPYQIGFITEDITYTTRQGDERTLRVAMWYPTRIKKGRTARYMKLLGRPGIWANAPFADDLTEKRPVLVFSHGNSGIAEQNYFTFEHLASHGWIAVSPDHTKNTFLDQEGGAINLKSAVVRPQDISATIDHVYDLPPMHTLAGKLSDDLVLNGHSFGGYTTLATIGASLRVDYVMEECADNPTIDSRYCEAFSGEKDQQVFREGFLDERVKVAVPMTPAGAIFFGEGIGQITIPTLVMTGTGDESLPNDREGDPIWAAFQGEQHMRLDLAKGGHFTFSNMCNLNGVELIDYDGCGDEYIAAETAHKLINHYIMAFAGFHLWGDDTHIKLLNGEELPYEGVTLSLKGETLKRRAD